MKGWTGAGPGRVLCVDRSAGVGKFLRDRKITIPVAIDQGETAKRYAISAWPTYFLIDKNGKVISGFSQEPPKESQIDELLR